MHFNKVVNYQPIIIIGAPRSGTNMIREALCSLEDTGTWPCDEINYIWRHGNVSSETDEFSPDMATENVKSYIRKKFDQMASKLMVRFLVEKTCANSLRVAFVDRVIPNAKYVYIVRDGIDVAESAAIRWRANLNIFYILKKIRYVPFLDIPFYSFRYFLN